MWYHGNVLSPVNPLALPLVFRKWFLFVVVSPLNSGSLQRMVSLIVLDEFGGWDYITHMRPLHHCHLFHPVDVEVSVHKSICSILNGDKGDPRSMVICATPIPVRAVAQGHTFFLLLEGTKLPLEMKNLTGKKLEAWRGKEHVLLIRIFASLIGQEAYSNMFSLPYSSPCVCVCKINPYASLVLINHVIHFSTKQAVGLHSRWLSFSEMKI